MYEHITFNIQHLNNIVDPTKELNKFSTNDMGTLVPKKEEGVKATTEQEVTSTEQSTPVTMTTTTTVQPIPAQIKQVEPVQSAIANQQGVIEITPADIVPTSVIDNSKEALKKTSLAGDVATTLKPAIVKEHKARNPKTLFQKADEFIGSFLSADKVRKLFQ